ncbi:MULTISPECIES: nucleotide sugar dehydrogenase [Catellatospora]|uniref:UDP-glucose 6-dehydrogenase n=2 Tax=Catellatospora TaxID=53365 RepID=A0A8J3KPY0_9ACTN|nr:MULTISPECIES: nucleotide sugar dehydrogenase [Catellatospora]RKE09658.1 GDP-mannose 6-dehydrogenase [Catellatospora citrea]GIF87196.1 GDP-mannose 6-dehydrogenase [Catellatospora chokoriensis]GIG02699.1 GDP-mannose 6-dehydrogenase [Catellatospora citrea]
MRIAVVGLGYVGCVSAACFASRGHEVIGVDNNPVKVDLTNRGVAPVVEERIGELTAEVVAAGRLRATTDIEAAIAASDVSLVCVGTPSAPNGRMSTEYLERVATQIGAVLADLDRWHTVVFRSTMLPGTCLDLLVPLLEKASGRTAGVDFGVAVNPEFLREGSSVRDFLDPPKTVIGQLDERSGDLVAELYTGLPGEVFRVPVPVAEMIKYVDNTFHGLKIAFANEIGAISRGLGLDSHQVMDVFMADRKLNISTAYLRPGFAFGGSCLPKDLRGLVYAARTVDVSTPLLGHVLAANEEHLRRAFDLVAATGTRKIGMFGLSFKPGTDDLRESPLADLAERLIGKGYDLRIYDTNVSLSRLIGANRDFIDRHLPHLSEVLVDTVDELLDHAEAFVVGHRDQPVLDALARVDDRPIVDLIRLPDAPARRANPGYVGIGW